MSAAEPLPAEEPAVEVEVPHLGLVEDEEPESERGGRVAAMASELRPYLPTRANLRGPLGGVGVGSRVLFGRGWAWLWAEGVQEAGIRAGGVALGAYAGIHTVAVLSGPYAPYIGPAAVVGWCVAARCHAPKTARTAPAGAALVEPAAGIEDQDDGEPEVDGDAVEPIGADDVAALIRAVAARHGHQGAHLEDLLAEPLLQGWEKGELKAALADDWSLPVESFKLMFPTGGGRAQRVRDGVRLKHLPPAPAEGVGEGPARGLSVVPSQPPVEPLAGAPAGTPPGAPAEAPVGVAVGPSPTGPGAPSQGAG